MQRLNSEQNLTRSNFIVAFTILLLACIMIGGCGDARLREAQTLIDAQMLTEARALLEKTTAESPTSAHAHRLLGVVDVLLGDPQRAEASFDRAVSLQSDLREDVAQALFAIGQETPLEPSWFHLAVKYDPTLGAKIAEHHVELASAPGIAVQLAFDYLRIGVGFDDRVAPSASELLMDRVSTYREAGKLFPLLEAAELAGTFDSASSEASAELALDVFQSRAAEMAAADISKAIGAMVGLSLGVREGLRPIMVDLVETNFASNEGCPDRFLGRASSLMAILWDHDFLPSPREQWLRSMLVRLANHCVARQEEFVEVAETLFSEFPDVCSSTEPLESYVCGVDFWRKDENVDALAALRRVPESARRQLGIEFIDKKVPAGTYEIENGVRSGDFGWGSFEFSIGPVEVTADGRTVVSIRVTNRSGRRQHFIFYGIHALERGRHKGERFHIVDQAGQKFYANPPHFVGAQNRERFNSTNDAVILEPGQVISDEMTFPRLATGSTGFRFVSPMHNGHQWEIDVDVDLIKPTFRAWREVEHGVR